LRVDGGAARNNLLMQFQADIAQVTVERPTELESTGRGAAMLAAVGAGLAKVSSAGKLVQVEQLFEPKMPADVRDAHLAKWRDAVGRSRSA
ncbi:MAG: FGGY-family carbohydrate kinase, partial [Polyangiaceae bacterium]